MNKCSNNKPICLRKEPNKFMTKTCRGQNYNPVYRLTKLQKSVSKSGGINSLRIEKKWRNKYNFCSDFDRAWLFIIDDIRHKILKIKNKINQPIKHTDSSKIKSLIINKLPHNYEFSLNIKELLTVIIQIGRVRWNINGKIPTLKECICPHNDDCGKKLGLYILRNIKLILESQDFLLFNKILSNKNVMNKIDNELIKEFKLNENHHVKTEIQDFSLKRYFLELLDVFDNLFEICKYIINSNSNLIGTVFNDLIIKILKIQIFFNVNKEKRINLSHLNCGNKPILNQKSFLIRINEELLLYKVGGNFKNNAKSLSLVFSIYFLSFLFNFGRGIYNLNRGTIQIVGVLVNCLVKALVYPFQVAYGYLVYYLLLRPILIGMTKKTRHRYSGGGKFKYKNNSKKNKYYIIKNYSKSRITLT